ARIPAQVADLLRVRFAHHREGRRIVPKPDGHRERRAVRVNRRQQHYLFRREQLLDVAIAEPSGHRAFLPNRLQYFAGRTEKEGDVASPRRKGSVGSGMTWMFIISLLLFWLPVVGPLIAGLVGGRKAGGVGNAIVAVFLPIVVTGVALTVFGSALTGI